MLSLRCIIRETGCVALYSQYKEESFSDAGTPKRRGWGHKKQWRPVQCWQTSLKLTSELLWLLGKPWEKDCYYPNKMVFFFQHLGSFTGIQAWWSPGWKLLGIFPIILSLTFTAWSQLHWQMWVFWRWWLWGAEQRLPKDICLYIPRTCRRYFADVITLRILRWGDYSGFIHVRSM